MEQNAKKNSDTQKLVSFYKITLWIVCLRDYDGNSDGVCRYLILDGLALVSVAQRYLQGMHLKDYTFALDLW